MSYCRGEVYAYHSMEGYICQDCKLSEERETSCFTTPGDFLAHLIDHDHAGHETGTAIDRITQEMMKAATGLPPET